MIRREWSGDVCRRLARALGDDADIIGEQVRAGIAAVWEADDGRGLMVLRREGPELVIVAGAGRNLGPMLDAITAATTADTARLHSARRGMGRLIAPHGFRYAETVYRWRRQEHGR